MVAHLSNLKAVKRPLDLVLSAELALRAEPRLVYVVVGDGADRQAMENECRQRELASRFRFAGWVDYSQIPAYLKLADVVISMSESEGLSRVYLEAQASARLLLASDIAPAREVIDDGLTGLLFRKGDVEHLADRTVQAAGDPGLRTRIGRRARARVQAHSLNLAVDRYLTTFSGCIGRRLGGARQGMTKDASRGFVVLSAPRSGSTWFLDLLNRATDATVHGELFIRRKKAQRRAAHDPRDGGVSRHESPPPSALL